MMTIGEWSARARSGAAPGARFGEYSYAFLEEGAKKEVRRKTLKAVAIPGYQAPFASPELPIARGWGTGGLQLTLSLILPGDVLKVIDQGCDGSVNAMNIRRFVRSLTGVSLTTDTREATVIQTRHRIPEDRMTAGQILVLQVPYPEALREVEPSEQETRRMHAEADYARMWLHLYEDIVRFGEITISYRYPVTVDGRYVMDPSPIPRWDVPKLHMADTLFLFGAGREKRIYAIPPHTRVEPLEFEDFVFRMEDQRGQACSRCGATDAYLDEVIDDASGARRYACSDSGRCDRRCA
jgi:alpha-D-ribose 1-methylphosphonate 5-phosphate C-P lyase